ncbi:MAG: MOSC domain-containing protein [Acidobacteria bacterium]|nr:MOSC domain-containing protein [Acidobacteriota bacterium]
MRPFENDQIITLTTAEIEARIDHVLAAPKDEGRLEMIVRRPATDAREVIQEGELDLEVGLVGDNWLTRGSSRTDSGLGHPEMQLNLMNCRFAELIAGSRERMPLAGDQLFVDLDMSGENLPPGTRIKVGDAVIEVTAIPHTGCKKFVERFGLDAMKFANSDFGRRHSLRGINAKVVEPGKVRTGDAVVVTSRPLRDT